MPKVQIVVDGLTVHEYTIDSKESFSNRLMSLCFGAAARSLYEYGMRLYGKLTDEEKSNMDNGTFRLPRAVILGMEPEQVLQSQIGAEAITDTVKKLRRLDKKRS